MINIYYINALSAILFPIVSFIVFQTVSVIIKPTMNGGIVGHTFHLDSSGQSNNCVYYVHGVNTII